MNMFSFSHNSFLLCEAHVFSKNVWYKQETHFIIYSETVSALYFNCNMCWILKSISQLGKKLRKGFDQNLFNTYCSHTQTSIRFSKWCEELNRVKNILKSIKNFPWSSLRTVDFIYWIRISNPEKDKVIFRGNPGASPYLVAYWLDSHKQRYWTMAQCLDGPCWHVPTLKGQFWEQCSVTSSSETQKSDWGHTQQVWRWHQAEKSRMHLLLKDRMMWTEQG